MQVFDTFFTFFLLFVSYNTQKGLPKQPLSCMYKDIQFTLLDGR